jgi:16S rRNA (adenine1518-N6/adenine1519-N6)-dimethyltransferase
MPLSYTETRELLARMGHNPKRFLGQNFLVDGNIVRKSLELAQIQPGDCVVEVGPGLGTLSSALLEAGAHLWAVEKDRGLHQHLSVELLPGYRERFHLMEGDAMEHPLADLPDNIAQSGYKIVANLPYAISTPWMDEVLERALPSRMVLMLQREAADRYAAEHGGKQFGSISIFLQAAFKVDPGHKVASSCFFPKPDVDSYLLNLSRKPEPFIFDRQTKGLIRSCFQQRRKQIGSLLRNRIPDNGAAWFAELEKEGLNSQTRPEQIPWQVWTKLKAPQTSNSR